MRFGIGEGFDGLARDANARKQRLHGELWMHEGGRVFFVLAAGELAPGSFVEIGVEARQYDRAVRKLCDRREQFCSCRHRTGRAGGDHRIAAAGETFHLGIDEKVASPGRIDRADFRKTLRPIAARDLQEVECELPIFIELVRHQLVELFPVHLASNDVIDQTSEIVGQGERGGGRIGDQWRTFIGTDLLGPAHDQLCEQQSSLQRTDRGRQRQGSFGDVSRSFREDDLILVDIAERDDARQDRGLIERERESIPGHAACAPRRQIERHAREFERIIGRWKAGHELSRAQRLDEDRQEPRGGRNIENAWSYGWHRVAAYTLYATGELECSLG